MFASINPESMLDRIRQADKDLDKLLAKYPITLQLERQTGQKKTNLVYAALAAILFLIIYNYATLQVVALVTLGYPLLKSLESIEAHDKAKDAQFLAYWSVLASLSLLEVFVLNLANYLPLYNLAKIALAAWMFLPQTKGSLVIYDKALKPVANQAKSLAKLVAPAAEVKKAPLASQSAAKVHEN